MHDRLSEILEDEVVGEVTQVGNTFFDVALGRICLNLLDRHWVDKVLAKLRPVFPQMQVSDQLHLEDPSQPVRGLVTVTLRQRPTPYLLQITGKNIVAYCEQRFLLEPALYGDLRGTLSHGLASLVTEGEAPLRTLSGHDELVKAHQQHLDVVLRAAMSGYDVDAAARVESMVEPVRRAWRLIPWPLRQAITPVSGIPAERIVGHDPVLRRTLLLAVDQLSGRLVYQYLHRHNPLEEYDQVMGWMGEVYRAVREAYKPPHHRVAMARASTIESFLTAFPGFQGIVGDDLQQEGEKTA